MGDDLSTGAKIGIGLVILCFLIAIVLSLLMVVKNITNSGANQLESGLGQMMATTYDDYDQKVVTGTKVTSAIKLFASEPVGIVVITGLCQENSINGGYCYGALIEGYTQDGQNGNYSYKCSTAPTRNTGDTFFTANPVTPVTYNLNTKPLTVSGTAQYVRDNGKFLAELIKDPTGTIIGICFTQQTV